MKSIKLLIIVDRDGTLVESDDWLGRDSDWKEKLVLIKPVIDFLVHLQHRYDPLMVVVTNQSGVARGYFDEDRVIEVHAKIAKELKSEGIVISSWQYAPDIDVAYRLEHSEVNFRPEYVKEETTRKPGTAMVLDGLKELNLKLEDFDKAVVLGDRHEDAGLAANLLAYFIDVKGKTFDDLLLDFNDVL